MYSKHLEDKTDSDQESEIIFVAYITNGVARYLGVASDDWVDIKYVSGLKYLSASFANIQLIFN